MSQAPRPWSRSPSTRGANGSRIPSTLTVSQWPHSNKVRPPTTSDGLTESIATSAFRSSSVPAGMDRILTGLTDRRSACP
jgi:hypothetical protein